MAQWIPPGGNLGAAQNTMAAQAQLFGARGANGSRNGKRRRRRSASSNGGSGHSRRKRRASGRAARNGKRAHLVKGSAAAKRYMAKLRRMRGK